MARRPQDSSNTLREEQSSLDGLERELNHLLLHARYTAQRASAALGAALIRERIGSAEAKEVAQAREARQVAESALCDLELVESTLPRFRENHANTLRSVHTQANAARRKQHRETFEANKDQFKRNFREIAKSDETMKRWTDSLFNTARNAGRAEEARELFREMKGISPMRDHILERY